MAEVSGTREDRKAGKNPNRMQVRAETAAVKPRTRLSSERFKKTVFLIVEIKRTRSSAPHWANKIPRSAPAEESKTHSVRSCRIRRKRLAPKDLRTATSLVRAAARA